MSIMKDIYIEECEKLYAEAEESGRPIDENRMGEQAYNRMKERFADMCDEAKDRAKYK